MALDPFGIQGGGTAVATKGTSSSNYTGGTSKSDTGRLYDPFNVNQQTVHTTIPTAPVQKQAPIKAPPKSLLGKVTATGKGLATGVKNQAEDLGKSVVDIGKGAVASGSIPGTKANPVALVNANKAKAKDEGAFLQPIYRPLAEGADEIRHPLSKATLTPNASNRDARTIFGTKPIQNINAGVASNYDKSHNLLEAGAYGVGQIGQIVATLAGPAKAVGDAADGIAGTAATVTGHDAEVNAALSRAKADTLLAKAKTANNAETLGKTAVTESKTQHVPVVNTAQSKAGSSLLGKMSVKGAKTQAIPVTGKEGATVVGKARTIDEPTYLKESNKLSNAYNRESAIVKDQPPLKQKALQDGMDAKYQTLQEQLDESAGKTKVSFAQKPTYAPSNPRVKTLIESRQKQADAVAAPAKEAEATQNAAVKATEDTQAKVQKIDRQTELIQAKGKDSETGLSNVDKTKLGHLQEDKQQLQTDNPISDVKPPTASTPTEVPVNKPAPTETTAEPKTVSSANSTAPKSELVQQPETKTSGSALGTEAKAVQAGLTKEFEGKAEYSTGSFKDEAAKAVQLTKDDPQRAMDIAMGKTPGDNTIHEVAVAKALENKAVKEGDVETLRKLATSSRHTATSEAAQRLGAEGYDKVAHSPVKAIRQVSDARKAAVERKTGKTIAKATSETVKAIKAEKPKVTKETWSSFIDGLKC